MSGSTHDLLHQLIYASIPSIRVAEEFSEEPKNEKFLQPNSSTSSLQVSSSDSLCEFVVLVRISDLSAHGAHGRWQLLEGAF